MGRLDGRVAIVTGAASPRGIGFWTARRLHEEGASVVVTDLAKTVSDRATELGEEALGLEHDVSDPASWQAVVEATVQRFGRFDVLVNNAGITGRSPIDEMETKLYRRVVDTNLGGTYFGCQTAVTAFKAAGRGGSIVNVSSINSVIGMVNSSAYGASKGAVRALSKVVALEGAPLGIRCNTIIPGLIFTELHLPLLEQSPEAHRALADRVPMGRLGSPRDIAAAVAYLASDDAAYLTGAEIVVDGGYTVQ
jgi:NAD(P)-dependent dehydrogenase (short-subunit alcohol dehydrogenase family)